MFLFLIYFLIFTLFSNRTFARLQPTMKYAHQLDCFIARTLTIRNDVLIRFIYSFVIGRPHAVYIYHFQLLDFITTLLS